MSTMNAVDQMKLNNQKELVRLITAYVTSQIASTENGKKYLKVLGEREPQKALNKLGQTHAEIKKIITNTETDSAPVDPKDEAVMYNIDAMLNAYRGSKNDEMVAIGIIKSMHEQTAAPKGPAT